MMSGLDKKGKERGATVVEFALIALIFFLILWGIFEFGRAFYVRNSLQHLTRCMAREAVVLQPSSYANAKASCLMKGSGSLYTWPFYNTTPTDLMNAFRIRYYYGTPDGTCSSSNCVEEPKGTSYDDQMTLCILNDAKCIDYVQVYAVPGSYEELGLLRTWLQQPGATAQPYAATTMPAEAMGYTPK